MDVRQLQTALQAAGHDVGTIDGHYGPRTRAAVLAAMTSGPDTPLSASEIAFAADRIGVTARHIRTVWAVEASGAGFTAGRPTILFEPHRFSRATGHRFDRVAPDVSYRTWDRTKYPRGQDARYDQLVRAVGLDVDAGFASASYGAFQVLGENYALCGYASPFAFAQAQAQSEADQLAAFVAFVKARKLDDELRREDWAGFARGYNGTAYRANRYDTRLAAQFAKFGG